MAAHFIKVGEPAHDAELQALSFLKDGLPDTYVVYGNPWLIERTGVVHEIDAVVVAPHAIYVVEIKSYRGEIHGNDHDWYVPHPIRSPLKLNRKTSQVLHSLLKRGNFEASRVWVQGFVFLSAATHVDVRGPASAGRVHTRKTILAALQDEALVQRLSGRELAGGVSLSVQGEVLRLLQSNRNGPQPVHRIREYDLQETLEHSERYSEVLGKNRLDGSVRVLRIYNLPTLANQAEQERIETRARWEAQVLGRLGRCPHVLRADPPFQDEAGIVLPLEHFPGVSLPTWLERHGDALARRKNLENLKARIGLWLKLVDTLRAAHEQGVVHRLLRPEVVLVQDQPDDPDLRITGFDLAKQMQAGVTVALTALSDERLRFAAPEVLQAFSSATPASDQFSLGALLGLLVTGRFLFESTRDLLANGRLILRPRDLNTRLPATVDEAIARMLSLRSAERFPSLLDARRTVEAALQPERRPSIELLPLPRRGPADPDNLEPGDRVGTDYEIMDRLGEGGLAVVYAAKHLVSGRVRALKIARPEDPAEEALRGEYQVLSGLDHPAIVRVIDLSKMVEDRLTLVMERVGGSTLRRWLEQHRQPDLNTLRRYAEDLLAALEYLEQKGVTHKDLKPDNLLVGDDGLKVIDFSLALMVEDAPFGGTALYRDPASLRWTHATDRYAAALCLFELYTGRHAFEGRAPEPGEQLRVAEQDIDPPGLAAFFAKALHPVVEQRFPSARALRDALLAALGERPDVEPEVEPTPTEQLDATTDLRLTSLSRRAVNQLRRASILTVGELLALTEQQVRAIHAIGHKTAREILDFQQELQRRGLRPELQPRRPEAVLVPELADSAEPIQKLAIPAALQRALFEGGLTTVGLLAGSTRSELLRMEGIGSGRLAQLLEALRQFKDRTAPPGGPATLDALWHLASRPLAPPQVDALERHLGLTGLPATQSEVAEALGTTQSQVSTLCTGGLERLDRAPLSEPSMVVDVLLEGLHGLCLLSEAGRRLEESWPPERIGGEGMLRLLVRLAGDRLRLVEVDGLSGPVLARPAFTPAMLQRFVQETYRLAEQWPPADPEPTRKALQAALPEFEGDPLALALRLCDDVKLTESGKLFIPPVDPPQSLKLVLDEARLPLSLEELAQRVHETFQGGAPFPEQAHLLEVLGQLGFQVQGGQVVGSRERGFTAPPGRPDPLPQQLGPERTHELIVRDLLRQASASRGFRMLVTPPERHAAIGKSVAQALGGHYHSFEQAWFERHGAELVRMERAERFVAQRGQLTRSAERLFDDLLEEHGTPGTINVLGDTALLGLFDALDQLRRFYDLTLSGEHGFWVLVIPGIIHDRQPLFNEKVPVWHLEGCTLPLLQPIPLQEGSRLP